MTTSEWLYQHIIQSVTIFVRGLQSWNGLSASIFHHASHRVIATSERHYGAQNVTEYTLQLPLQNEEEEFVYLLPNHEYTINIRIDNVKTVQSDSIEILLQNIGPQIYYPSSSPQYFSSMKGALFIYSDFFPFNVAHNAVSEHTPYGTICIICGVCSVY